MEEGGANMKRLNLTIVAFLLFIIESAAQTTGLFTYDGGYFIKDGNNWTEYRPKDKEGSWASYTQYSEEENYYNIRNSKCSISVPKKDNNNFYIYKNGQWEIIYYTKDVYDYFTAAGRQIYCYNGGYFVRSGSDWAEYRPKDKRGVWASYRQYGEEENYYNVRNSLCSLSIPKKSDNKIYIYKNGSWEVCYATTGIYDAFSEYDYILHFKYYKVADAEGELQEVNNPASIGLSRKGKMRLCCGNKSYEGSFKRLSITTIKDIDVEMGFKLTVDDDNYIQFIGDWCMVNVKSICPFMDFMECSDNDLIEKIKDSIKDKSFFSN